MKLERKNCNLLLAALLFSAIGFAAPPDKGGSSISIPHPAVGSWFGKAEQFCSSPATCQNVTLLMTPTIGADLSFIANDSLSLGGPPFGPHTTAHGRWIPTGPESFVADYVFMLPGTDKPPAVTVLRFRWSATVVDFNTIQGFVNIYFGAPVPITFSNLATDEFPKIPDEAAFAVTPPISFYKNPAGCSGGPPACPLIFKFTVKRVQP